MEVHLQKESRKLSMSSLSPFFFLSFLSSLCSLVFKSIPKILTIVHFLRLCCDLQDTARKRFGIWETANRVLEWMRQTQRGTAENRIRFCARVGLHTKIENESECVYVSVCMCVYVTVTLRARERGTLGYNKNDIKGSIVSGERKLSAICKCAAAFFFFSYVEFDRLTDSTLNPIFCGQV